MYKAICPNCTGNGYINIVDRKGETEIKQCWTCESEGELTYDEKVVIGSAILITTSGCSEFALLASGSSIAVSQNAYVKAYNGFDVLTIMSTEKDIKNHVYSKTKEFLNDKRRQQ